MNRKREGEIAQAGFVHRALQNGYSVLEPVGDSDRFDCVLNKDRKFCRIQVRSTKHMTYKNVYSVPAHFKVRRGHGPVQQLPYTVKEIDLLAATIIPEDSWFLIPVEELKGRLSIQLYSKNHRKPGPFAKFKDAWHQLLE